MDFESAARRLENDQKKLKSRAARTRVISEKARREADFRRKQQQKRSEERRLKQQQEEYQQSYFTKCERSLGTKSLKHDSVAANDDYSSSSLVLKATSIHGDGDKVALPPSVLQFLTEKTDQNTSVSPWTFRIGIRRDAYEFPASPSVQIMKLPKEQEEEEEEDDDDDEEGDEEDESSFFGAYLDELSYKYISYTHGTVVEFTQDEGHIGLPASIAARLIESAGDSTVPTMRTQDPAAATKSNDADHSPSEENDEDKTPGHLAWGAFVVPDMPIEVTLVNLPKGRHCTLVPTKEAIFNGFHQLKDVKLVLEQSLIRTRATLSVGDTVHTWHRGLKFDLKVESVSPADFHAVSCINTDIEVDIGVNEEVQEMRRGQAGGDDTTMDTTTDNAFAPGVGHRLTDDTPAAAAASQPVVAPQHPNSDSSLLPEPPLDQTENVCTVQIRTPHGAGRRRFDVGIAKLKDLFAYAAYVSNVDEPFQLVTRFPRRVVTLSDDSKEQTIQEAGVNAGQELFILETL
jgi:hypothetical protein